MPEQMTNLKAGDIIKYYDPSRGWRFGHIVRTTTDRTGKTSVWISIAGKIKKVKPEEIQPYVR